MFIFLGNHKIGIIGDANSGKTVLLTSLLWNLEAGNLALGKKGAKPTSIEVCNDWLASLTVFPRVVAIMGLALLWSITPFDALPDFIPFYGILDDVAVSALSIIGFQGTLKPFLQERKG